MVFLNAQINILYIFSNFHCKNGKSPGTSDDYYRDHPKQLVSPLEYFSAWILSAACHSDGSELMSKSSWAPRQIPLKSLTQSASSDSMSAHAHTIRAYPFIWHTLSLHLSMYLTFMYQCSIGQFCYFILQMKNRQTVYKVELNPKYLT